MSTEKFLNNIRQHAVLATSNAKFVTTGVITAYDPAQYAVIVQTDVATSDFPALQTGWIPLASAWVGNQWGMFSPPNLGDICSVYFQDGDTQVPFAALRFYGDNNRPLSVDSGEFWLVHKSGSFVKFTNDGKVSLNGNVEIDITSPAINITVTGLCNISGTTVNIDADSVNIGDTGSSLDTLINGLFENTFNTHVHASNDVPPTTPMPSNNKTTTTRAN